MGEFHHNKQLEEIIMKLEPWAYVDGLNEAVVFYQEVFNAQISEEGTWKNDDGSYEICAFALDNGTTFNIAERNGSSAIEGVANTGNVMQMCMLFSKVEVPRLESAYEMLKDGGQVLTPLQGATWTSHTCDLIDKYGVRWCLMVW